MSARPQSMTGIGQSSGQYLDYNILVQIKSVNNRFLETRIKLPSSLALLEIEIKKKIQQFFKRGSFDLYINLIKDQGTNTSWEIDVNKIQSFLATVLPSLKDYKDFIQISPTDFLRSDFQKLQQNSFEDNEFKKIILDTIVVALEDIKNCREKEGSGLIDLISKQLEIYEKSYNEICILKDSFHDEYSSKIRKNLEELKIEIDEARFHQELVYYLERMDIEEEISRIKLHLTKIKEVIGLGPCIGKEMDFLLQELSRETNTIGSKTASNKISQSIVEMKLCLDKIKEQALNLQ